MALSTAIEEKTRTSQSRWAFQRSTDLKAWRDDDRLDFKSTGLMDLHGVRWSTWSTYAIDCGYIIWSS